MQQRTVIVGGIPYGLAYDDIMGKVFVANAGSDTVSVISDRNDTVVDTIHVESAPHGIIYDTTTGKVFVANLLSGTVSVLSDRNDTVVDTVSVGAGPHELVLDPNTGTVFVANRGSGTISAISDKSDRVVATMRVGSGIFGIACDPKDGKVFVTTANSTLLALSESGRVLSSVSAGSYPFAVAYDDTYGTVFVTGTGHSLSVLPAGTGGPVSTVRIGASPYYIAEGPGGSMLVSGYNSDAIYAISGAGDRTVSEIKSGQVPFGMVYDSGRGEIFATVHNSDSVLAIPYSPAGAVPEFGPSLVLVSSVSVALAILIPRIRQNLGRR